MTVSISGEARALKSLKRAPGNYRRGVNKGMHQAGSLLVAVTKREILSGSKSGRLYGSHQASAPGEYSAFLTGEHFASLDYNVNGPREFEFGAGAPHSIFLELKPETANGGGRHDLGKTVRAEERTVTDFLGRQVYYELTR